MRLPDADALLAFADGHSKIVAREAVELNGDLRDGPTIGSGPWIYDPESPADTYAFSRNPGLLRGRNPILEQPEAFTSCRTAPPEARLFRRGIWTSSRWAFPSGMNTRG